VISRGAATAVAALAVLVTACSAPIAGTASPVGRPASTPGGGLPLDPEQQRKADLFAEIRTWDMCAMHDVEAAARATGFAPDALTPYRELGICRLVMKEPNGTSEWELQLDVLPVIPTEGGGQPLAVDGVELPQVRDNTESRCAYSLPIGPPGAEPWGVEISVFTLAGNKAPCDVAGEYATAILPRMTNPPLRRDGGTSPALDLAASDPCAMAAAMVPTLSGGLAAENLEVADLEPFKCTVTVKDGDGVLAPAARGTVEFTLASAGDLQGATVAGFPASRTELGIFCEMVFAPSDVQLQDEPDVAPDVPAVVTVGECDQIDALAAAAAGAITPAPEGGPREDALALGDLDPPPTPESVGAPFDPCTVVGGWQAYPAEVQPPTPRQPAPAPVESDDPFEVGCKFNAGEMFSSLVWGMPSTDGFSADPAARPNGVPAQFGGRPGVEERTSTAGRPTCYSAVEISRGIAAVVTSVPGFDSCAVNRAVLDQVAQRVP
jgi:hypothetical protein